MITEHKKHNRAFTLIEAVIYIALFGILMSGVIVATDQLIQGSHRNEQSISIQEEGTFIIRKINWALSSASSVSSLKENTLVIHMPDGILRTIWGDGSGIYISKSNNIPVVTNSTVLNASAFPVSSLFFVVSPASSGKPAGVSVSFSILGRAFIFKRYLR
ncbi:MAG: prepilin-type N-terminal cleavage/methylation domain-containing protein [bacterium]